MAYENDGYGSRLYGEFDNLYNAVVKGADARVRFPLQNVVAPLRNVATITSPDCVCGQIIFNWEKDGYDRFNVSI